MESREIGDMTGFPGLLEGYGDYDKSAFLLPRQDIAIEVGYYNVTSFIRRFKQQSGQTPNDYRKNHS